MYLDRLFKMMAERQASDLFISCGAPINMKVNGVVAPLSDRPMDLDTVRRVAYELMSEEQAKTFETEFEMNLSHLDPQVGNFRINIFPQRGDFAVIRQVRATSRRSTSCCRVLLDLVMEKRGLVIIAGATVRQSTTLAAMIDHRNTPDHILTVEDPIEYLFRHKKSVVNQRELTVDTLTIQGPRQRPARAPDPPRSARARSRDVQQALLPPDRPPLNAARTTAIALSRISTCFRTTRARASVRPPIGLRAIVSQRLVRRRRHAAASRRDPPQRRLSPSSSRTARSADQGSDGEVAVPRSQTFERRCAAFISTAHGTMRR
jgi:twitching motility protein PilU